jgi:hypothetical protein
VEPKLETKLELRVATIAMTRLKMEAQTKVTIQVEPKVETKL